ncbi:helix-turn-helix domain-containing protein [Bacillus sp. J33]|uniref:helix-turn-helix domain-containing protein n=1 Tax=Bacillus sp. J33 TaxID=935836 RepID=UPI00047A1BA2|nr:helix-turn-helix domain-containing protein [Bacillus sp. J33]
MERILNVHEAIRILKRHYITATPQSVSRYIREGRLYAEKASRKDGYKIKESDLYEFMDEEMPMIGEVMEIYDQFIDGELVPKREPPSRMSGEIGPSPSIGKAAKTKDEPPAQENEMKLEHEEVFREAELTSALKNMMENAFSQVIDRIDMIDGQLKEIKESIHGLNAIFEDSVKTDKEVKTELLPLFAEIREEIKNSMHEINKNLADSIIQSIKGSLEPLQTAERSPAKNKSRTVKDIHKEKTFEEFLDLLYKENKIKRSDAEKMDPELRAIYHTYFDDSDTMKSEIKVENGFRCPETGKVTLRFVHLVAGRFNELLEKAKEKKLKVQEAEGKDPPVKMELSAALIP